MSEWKVVRLESILEKITKGTTPPKGVGFVDKGINYIKSDAINYDGRIDKEKFVQIDLGTHEQFKRSQLEENDILFSMAGAYLGKNALVKKEMLPANTNQALAILRLNKNLSLPKYINYYLLQPQMVDFINNMSGQSAQPNINFQEISSIEILLPSLEEQKAIAEVLSSLDDKIDLLSRQNKTLEELAQTLFRQCFIEEANDEWKKEIGSTSILIIDGDRGKNYPKSTEFTASGYCLFLNAKNVTANGFNFSECNYISKEKDEVLRSGKLRRNDIILTTRGTIGNLALYDELIEYNNIRINSGMIIFRTEEISPIYLYVFLKSQYFTKSVIEQTSGSAQPQLPIRDIKNIKIIIPPNDILESFLFKINPLYEKVSLNQKQIKTLENMRDTLLPKLMSGEVRVNI